MTVKRAKLNSILSGLVIVIVACFLQYLTEIERGPVWMQKLEWMTFDWRMQVARNANPPYATNKLAGVLINKTTEDKLLSGDLGNQYVWPYPRLLHGEVVRELKAQGAELIAFDVLFNELQNVGLVFDDRSSDQLFAADMAKAGNVILAAHIDDEAYPPDLLATNALAIGEISTRLDLDGVTRKVAPFVDDGDRGRRWNMGLEMGARMTGIDLTQARVSPKEIRLKNSKGEEVVIPLDHQGMMLVDWVFQLTNDEAKSQLHLAPYSELLVNAEARKNGLPAPQAFKGKTVLIGSTSIGKNLADVGATPITHNDFLMTIYWNIANSVYVNRFIHDLSLPLKFWIIAVFCLISAYLSWYLRVFVASVAVTGTIALYLAVSHLLFVQYRLLIPIVYPVIIALLFTHVITVTYRVFFEQNERRRVKAVFSKIVSPNVVDELLGAEAIHLGGARRRVTVLFTDVRGFTEMTDVEHAKSEEFVRAQKLDEKVADAYYDSRAREVLGTVNIYLGAIADTVKAHNGTLDKYIGDCVMAFWGAPTPNERHAQSAVRAAIDAQRKIYQLNQERARENAKREEENLKRVAAGEPALDKLVLLTLGTGLNTGMVMVGLMGSDQHILNYTVFGREVNVAARLEGVSGRGRIIIGEGTYLELKVTEPGLAERCIAQTPVIVKGIREPINTYEVPWRDERTIGGSESAKI